jgi:hypothetical protein
MIERRRFFRVVYSTPAQLQQGEQVWSTTLLDLSLQGALLNRPANWTEQNNGLFTLSFTLADSDIEIRMEVESTHLDEQKLGVYCHHIDIDSASHLRRLIELNAGDTELLLREFAHLLEDHKEHQQPHTPSDSE